MAIPSDVIEAGEASLDVLEQVLAGLGPADATRQTPCTKFDVAALTDHLMNSITVIGGLAGAELPDRDAGAPIIDQVTAAARPALAAWRRRGLEGTVPAGPGEMPAAQIAGILSLEFLVHAWDYATAVGRQVAAPDDLAEYVLGITRSAISPAARAAVGFDDPVEVPADASALDQLIGFTGRHAT
ncbi:TIGR03086 family metal-binding protein [Mycolicibacterium sp. CBMA 226]|uniref:TIGR03086 family metal-binding protein n=1 Tax=Mycolicibacterium sp. CBMA 226 TaxID=2606611 RepID=UPI0012DD96BF|nr:TIGR03086 family metal-binding protein [Mycolicibacterium sp. CBMA 226]MUL79886.1 TIGR03086 family protein [Mycolicibacterium sp. CBMA 226]